MDAIQSSTYPQSFRDSRGIHTRRIPDTGNPVIRAFVKTTPGATTSVDVYLREDATGEEVTVVCYVYGTANLNASYPTLVDGMPLYVQYDEYAGEWKNVTRIDKIGEDCN